MQQSKFQSGFDDFYYIYKFLYLACDRNFNVEQKIKYLVYFRNITTLTLIYDTRNLLSMLQTEILTTDRVG